MTMSYPVSWYFTVYYQYQGYRARSSENQSAVLFLHGAWLAWPCAQVRGHKLLLGGCDIRGVGGVDVFTKHYACCNLLLSLTLKFLRSDFAHSLFRCFALKLARYLFYEKNP